MGVRFWDPAVEIAPEDVTIRFHQGRPVAVNGVELRRPGRARAGGERDRRPARAGHVRPDREPDHRGQVARRLRGARDGAALDLLRAAAQRDPQRGHDRELPRRGAPARPAALRGPVAGPAGADAARVPAALGRVRGHRRGDPAAAARARTTRSCAPTGRTSPTTPTSCRWSAPRTPCSGPATGSASSTMRNLDIADSRAMLELYADAAAGPGTGPRRARHPARRAAGGWRGPDRGQPGAGGRVDDEALDAAAMEFGTD